MSITINCKGLYTPGGNEERDMAYLDVEYNDTHYDWIIYVPQGVNLGIYLEESKPKIQAQIDAKELEWANLDPKTKTEYDLNEQEIVVAIQKEDIVKPEIPDYYAKRKAEYPSIGDQIGALINPNASPSLAEIIAKIQEVKAKYPKS
jgi:hypothetical protein